MPRETVERYLSAMEREIEEAPYLLPEETVVSVFFGGGTPTLLLPSDVERLLSLLRKKYAISPSAEITVEANPKTGNEEKLRAFLAAGVNRLSIGMQSFVDKELSLLGRLHTAKEGIAFFHAARNAGFKNINIDLIYAIPTQTRESLKKTLDTALSLCPEHISAYGLILEEGTDFFKNKDNILWQTDEEEADFYETVSSTLASSGYEHYEISNYARKGFRSCHNMGYWQSRPYLGFGASAASLYGGKRVTNTRDLDAYISDPTNAVVEVEQMNAENSLFDYVMMALRTSDGISESDFFARFGFSFYQSKKAEIDRFVAIGYMSHDGSCTRFTSKGFYVSSAILVEIL